MACIKCAIFAFSLCLFASAALPRLQLDASQAADHAQYSNPHKLTNISASYTKRVRRDLNWAMLANSSSSENGNVSDHFNTVNVFEEEPTEPLQGIYIGDAAKFLASFLRKLSNEELGVTAMQAIYDNLPFGLYEKDDGVRVTEISDKIQAKLSRYFELVNKSKTIVEELFWHHLHRPLASLVPCCDITDANLRYDDHFGTFISKEYACDVTLPSQQLFAFTPGHNLTEVFASNRKLNPIKWQYFLGPDGVLSEYPSHRGDSRTGCKPFDVDRRRNLFFKAVKPQKKYVIIVLDHSSALNAHQLNLAKTISKYLLSTLSEDDYFGLIALSDEVRFANGGCMSAKGLVQATPENKFVQSQYIDTLTRARAAANHTLGFLTAFDMLKQYVKTESEFGPVNSDACQIPVPETLFLYVSRGLLTSLAEPKILMNLIRHEQNCVKGQVVINTYAVIDEGKPIMYEKSFLQDLASQNFSRYNVSGHEFPVKRGVALAVNSTKGLSATVGDVYSVLNVSSVPSRPVISWPSWDPIGKGLVVSISQACYHLDHLIGVIGLDLHLSDLVEDITYFKQPGPSYAFIVDESGLTLMHPSMPRPSLAQELPLFADISSLELREGFLMVRKRLFSEPSGTHTLISLDPRNSSASHQKVHYTWEKVAGYPYVVCIVSVEYEGQDIRVLKRVSVPSPTDVVYHRLDLVSTPTKVQRCRYFKQMATIEASSMYLPPSCFQSPFRFESRGEATVSSVQSYAFYLNDRTKLIANPGFRSGIRSDVLALSHLAPHWKTQFTKNILSQFIVRRFGATHSGVYLQHPGGISDWSSDPTRKVWFERAVKLPGRVIISGPYLDPIGAGYVVSLSHTIYEGKPAALHGPSDQVVAVLGADFTLSYMYRLLVQSLPFCALGETPRVRCFLMDDQGYLIVHPNLMEPNSNRITRGAMEWQHITHHEPLVASDLLSHPGFVTKKACLSFTDQTIQRFYQLNLSLSMDNTWASGKNKEGLSVFTNLVHGEHCSKYQIVPIPGTNAFLGVVNQTCETATAFCPCSTVDRLCLNCHRMEQSECECPCECPLEADMCLVPHLTHQHPADSFPLCDPSPEPARPASVTPQELNALPSCVSMSCEHRLTENECLGVVGCEWCTRDTGGEESLPDPFCTLQRKCFGGVLRGISPYNDGPEDFCVTDTLPSFRTSPVGPVAGVLLGVFMLMALSIYCYRQHGSMGRGHQHGSYVTSLRMSQLDIDGEEEPHDMDLEPNGDQTAVMGHEMVLAGVDNVAIVSPYRVSTNYRRPQGGDSDHGYSTMTPHEDSEHTAPSIVEPLLIGRDRYRPAPGSVTSASVNSLFSSRASSPLSQPFPKPPSHPRQKSMETTLSEANLRVKQASSPPPQQTRIPEETTLGVGHQTLAPVTVHMVDSA